MPAINDDNLHDLYENAPCGYLSMLSDGRIIKANATLSSWTGHSPERLLQLHFHDLLTVTGRIFYEAHIAPVLHAKGFFDEATLDLATAAGVRLAVMVNARRLPESENRPSCIRLAFFKATERRLYERDQSLFLDCLTHLAQTKNGPRAHSPSSSLYPRCRGAGRTT